MEKVAEIKRINAQMMAIKSEISKYEDTLKEYQLYKKFLSSVTPKVCIDVGSIRQLVGFLIKTHDIYNEEIEIRMKMLTL
jgi:hypothetical protein